MAGFTDEEMKLARDLLALAIDHPWTARPTELTGAEVVEGVVVDIIDANGMYICTVRNDPGSAAFIAAAPELVGAALDEVDRISGQLTVVRAERDQAQADVASLETAAAAAELATMDVELPPGWEIRLEARYAGERALELALRFFDAPSDRDMPDIGEVREAFDKYRKAKARAAATEKPS